MKDIDKDLEAEVWRQLEAENPAAQTAPAAAAPEAPTEDDEGFLEQAGRVAKSIGIGGMKAGFETKDFVSGLFGGGEPEEGDKHVIRKLVEDSGEQYAEESTAAGLAMGVSQMVVGLVGAGKIMGPIKVAQKLAGAGKAGRLAYESVKAAAASVVVLDPHEKRLSNLVETYPALSNPVTAYLAAAPDDSAAEGRFKNAIESLGVDLAMIGGVKAFQGGLKVIKYLRGGDEAAARREIAKLAKATGDANGATVQTPTAPAAAAPGPAGTTQAVAPVKAAGGTSTDTLKQSGAGPTDTIIPEAPKAEDFRFGTKDIKRADYDTIVKFARADKAAISKYGSREAAIDNGYKFQKGPSLPYQKLRSTEDVRALIDTSAKFLKKRYHAMKGGAVLSDTKVVELVDDLSEMLDADPVSVMGDLVKRGEQAVDQIAETEVAWTLGQKMFNDVTELSERIYNHDLAEFGGDMALAEAEVTARLAAATDMFAAAQSLVGNAARNLRRQRGQFRITAANIDGIKSIPKDKLVKMLRLAKGDPRKLRNILNPSWQKRVLDGATWHLTNGLLWLWPTHTVNFASNSFMLIARPTGKLFGTAAMTINPKTFTDAGRRRQLSQMSRTAMREYIYTVTSIREGLHNAWEAFASGDSVLVPNATEAFDASIIGIRGDAAPWRTSNTVADLAENAYMAASWSKLKQTYKFAVGGSTRGLGTMDEFFKTMRYRAVIQSRAAVEAADMGLSGKALKDHVDKALKDSMDEATGAALDTAAIQEAKIATFQQDLNYDTYTGNAGKGIQHTRRVFPPFAMVLPFVKTPINVVRYGIKMTPGLNMLQKEFNDAIMGRAGMDAQAHAMGQMSMGAMFLGYGASLVLEGNFTHGGPSDYKLKQEMMATGWRPYSIIRHHEDGTKTYIPMSRFDPVGLVMGITADIMWAMEQNEDEDYTPYIGALAVAVAKNIGERTFVLNLKQFMDAASDPDDTMLKWAGRTAGGMIPFSSALRGHNPDPWLREARSFTDQIMRGIPGQSDKLAPKRDIYGDQVERSVGLAFHAEENALEAEVNRIIMETGHGIGKPSPHMEGVDLRDMRLKDGRVAYEVLQELGGHLPGAPSLKSILSDIVASDEYQKREDGDPDIPGTRLNILASTTSKYRANAMKAFRGTYPEVQELIGKRQQEQAEKQRVKDQQKGQGGVAGLLNALGQ